MAARGFGGRRDATVLPLRADLQPDLDEPDAAVDDELLDGRAEFEEALVLLARAEAHDVFDAGAVVPAPVEDHDLAAGREALDIALHVHLALLAVGRRRQCLDAENARADPLGDGLDRAALARRVAPLEHDDHAFAGLLDPILQVAEFHLQLVELLLVRLALELFRFFFARHDAPPGWRPKPFFGLRPSWMIIKGRNGR